jgi:hypothetical protein
MTTADLPVPGTFLVPPLDGEIVSVTRPIEELLLVLADGADDDPRLPATLHQPAATAIGALRLAILHAAAVSLYAPDGRYEHEPLAVVTVDEEHLTTFGAAVAELTAVLQPGKLPDVAEFLDDWADERGTTAEAVVALASRFHQLCQLAWGPDHDLLAERVEHARSSVARTVLTDDQEAAYRRLRDRWVAIWHHGDSLARWQY